jgi:hypothetical protein
MTTAQTSHCSSQGRLQGTAARLFAALALAGALEPAACLARPMPSTPPSIDAVIAAARADAARRSGLPDSALHVDRAEAVTWRDGSLGCPQPGMAYTQALVPGFRVRLRAGDLVLDYHAGRSGLPQWCPPGRAQDPLAQNPRS